MPANVVLGVAELATRINNLEAWAFVGGYQIGGGAVDATGYRLGVRGYAVPDVALSLQVTDDDVYATNVLFGITWFVGRTNRCNGPCATLYDRFREPVLRNDFIVTTGVQQSRASGPAAIDPDTGLSLGSSEEYIGRVTVKRSMPKFTLMEPTSDYSIDVSSCIEIDIHKTTRILQDIELEILYLFEDSGFGNVYSYSSPNEIIFVK